MSEEAKPELTRNQLLVKNASANAALLEFPTDQWGFTSTIRKEVLKAASAVQGQPDKHELLLVTLAVLMQHIRARKAPDATHQEQRMQRNKEFEAERLPRERVTGKAPVLTT